MKTSFLRWTGITAAGISFLIMFIAVVQLPRQWNRYHAAAQEVDASRLIIGTMQDYLSAIKDAETGQRGYLLTRDSHYLDSYRQGITEIPVLEKQMQAAIIDRPAIQDRFAQIEVLTKEKLFELNRSLDIAQKRGFTAALAEVLSGRGKMYMDEIRILGSQIEVRQTEDLSIWLAHAEHVGREMLLFAGFSITFLFLFLLTAILTLERANMRERDLVHAERASFNALQESEVRFRSLADAAPALVWTSGPDKKCDYFNKGWLEFTGRSLEQELGDGWAESVYPEDLSRCYEIYVRAFDARKPFRTEFRMRRHDGAYRWVVNQGVPRFLPNQEFVGFIGTSIDIHDRKLQEDHLEELVQERTQQLRYKEEELMQSRKLEAIGRLAGGVAHDFNNILTGIAGLAQDVYDGLPGDTTHRPDLAEILKATQRASSLTKQLLAFGRRQIASPVVLNLNTVLSEMTPMLKRLIGEDIQFLWSPGKELANTRIDPGQVEQIVINLVLNSRDALPQGGKITIETANAELDENYSHKHFAVAPGSYILLAVSDNGVGMDKEVQEHIFEPFFTTKERGQGTGLGLATVYGIVKQNNGDIFLYSTPGGGSTFKIYLPRTQEAVRTVAAAAPKNFNGTETILFVEDEEIVRRVGAKALAKRGYQVLQAASGKEALEIAATYQKPIDLLLTDVIMPGLNGRQLAELLAHERPQMKVLFTSGYTENIIVQRGMLKPGIAFIEKSFTAETLCAKVRDVLDAAPGVSA